MMHVNSSIPEKKENFFLDVLKFGIIALLIVAPIRLYVAKPFIVNGSSMSPTFENGHYLFIDQITYRLRAPERGEVIVFRFPLEPSKYFIKRIVGLPGETVQIKGQQVSIIKKGDTTPIVLDESYIVPGNRRDDFLETTLGTDEYFVMGDNRKVSSDSRVWGAVARKFLVGRAIVRLLPITESGLFPGAYSGIQSQI